MPRRRRIPAPFVVLAAVLALAAVAVAPRGMLRVVAAGDLPAIEHTAGVALTAPADERDLPGVRNLVAREEDDAGLAVAPAEPVSAVPASLAASPAESLTAPPPADGPPPPSPAPRSTDGDRAPPRPI